MSDWLRALKSFARWLSLVLPARSIVASSLVLCSACFVLWLVEFVIAGKSSTMVFMAAGVSGLMISVAYGAYRAMCFHPALNPSYRQWLETTPWTSDRPLPLGPCWLVWQDALVAVLLIVFGAPIGLLLTSVFWATSSNSTIAISIAALAAFPVLIGLFVYVVIAVLNLFLTGMYGAGYASLFLFACASSSRSQPALAATCCLLACVAVQLGLRRSIRTFPWKNGVALELLDRVNDQRVRPMGAWWTKIGPGDRFLALPWRDALALPALAGAWFYAALLDDTTDDIRGVKAVIVGVAVVARLLIYCWEKLPPLSVLGRIATWRWIIPRYDIVFVSPLAAVLIGNLGQGQLIRLGVAPAAEASLLLTAQLLCLTCLGPRHRDWSLTGPKRLDMVLLDSGYVRL